MHDLAGTAWLFLPVGGGGGAHALCMRFGRLALLARPHGFSLATWAFGMRTTPR